MMRYRKRVKGKGSEDKRSRKIINERNMEKKRTTEAD